MMRLILTMIFIAASTASFSQDYANDENYFKIVLDGEDAYISKITGEVVKPGQSYKKPEPSAVLNPRTTYTSKSSTSGTHTVSKGETLYSISRKYGVSVTDLKSKNRLTSNALSIGQTLSIPGHTTTTYAAPASTTTYSGNGSNYVVSKGDTLYSISRKFGKTVSQIKSMNGLQSNLIQPGQSLRVN